jgi:hypothetical protein
MGSDRSLDEFVGGTRESSTADTADAGDSPDSEEIGVTVEPAESTYSWSPAGATCASCGATVERRWRDEGDLVCADCKSW